MSQNHSTKDSSKTDPFVQQFFARIPSKTAATFSDTQLTALKHVFSDRFSKRHTVDIKLSIPFFQRGFYVVLLLGKEKRLKQRLQASSSTSINNILLITSGLVLITSLLSFYLVQMESHTPSLPGEEIQIKESKQTTT